MNRTKFWHRLLTATCALSVGGLVLASSPASAQSCLQEKLGKSVVCTANDVRIAEASNIRNVTDGETLTQCISGQSFSFTADFRLVTTATSRYDIGMWFATDSDPNGDGARSGICSANIIGPKVAGDPLDLGSAQYQKIDTDTCGDISTSNNNQIVRVRVNNVQCADTDGDGKVNLPNCTSWSQNTGVSCTTADHTVPGSPSKCSCDIAFNIPVLVETGSIQVTKDASPASRPEPGGAFTYTVGVTNSAQFTSLTVDRICDDKHGEIAKVASAAACPAGTLGNKTGTTCVVPQTVAPGASYSCTFTADITSGPTATPITDVVSVSGHDQNNTPVSGSDSAQVSITDVAPTATVVKSQDGLACAEVNYRVKVNNTGSAESLTLTALSDSGFGSITSVHDSVKATNCSVPQTIAVGSFYECTFRAHFCGSSHTDTVTATVNDNENTTITPSSNSLTVNVNATTSP